eukprot:326915-Alexandrium_andersonii.AAC.1
MSASLVGSEMCIRDSLRHHGPEAAFCRKVGHGPAGPECGLLEAILEPVSYTHLTLPTICSV